MKTGIYKEKWFFKSYQVKILLENFNGRQDAPFIKYLLDSRPAERRVEERTLDVSSPALTGHRFHLNPREEPQGQMTVSAEAQGAPRHRPHGACILTGGAKHKRQMVLGTTNRNTASGWLRWSARAQPQGRSTWVHRGRVAAAGRLSSGVRRAPRRKLH